jgi:hypothetical protein
MKHAVLKFLSVLCVLAPAAAEAQPQQHAYPAKGQSSARQAKDQSECSSWATKQTGYNPASPPPVAVAQPAPVTGSGARVRGAARGAVIGGIVTGDAGRGAATGAVLGGVRQRVTNRRAADAQNQANAQHAQATAASWSQARGACLTGRGYTVN